MYNTTDDIYILTDKIRKRTHQLLPHDIAMVNWLNTTCGINVLNFYFHTVQTSVGYKQQHVVIIVQSIIEEKNMPGKANYNSIIEKFHQYFDENKPAKNDDTKRKIYPRINGIYPETAISFTAMEVIDVKVASTELNKNIDGILQSVENVWVISNNGEWKTVFYYTDEQLKQNEGNGNSQKIRDLVLAEIKKNDFYGDFGAHSIKLLFDSKESFDRDYEGKWHYYYK